MPRKQRMFRLDERILASLEDVATNAGFSSANQFVEATLFNFMKMAGAIPSDAPPLSETRGGKRDRAVKGKPRRSATDDDQEQSPREDDRTK